ncbi:TPA: HEPN-associated N-terminal domain-containing protein, partial [Yersinia enterocolitica]
MWEEKYICHHCVNDVYIQNDIKKTGNTDNKCSYCNEKTETISIEELAAKVDIMLANHYEIADCNYEGEPTGDDLNNIIQEELEVDEDVASDIIESLHDQFNDYNEESKYSEEYTYSPINWHISPLNQKWDEISNSLLTEARFFNSGAKAFLDELFSDINVHSNTVIKKLNTNDPLYRARVFNDDQALEKALMHPEAELGPPP